MKKVSVYQDVAHLCSIHFPDSYFLASSTYFIVGVTDDTRQGDNKNRETSYQSRVSEDAGGTEIIV